MVPLEPIGFFRNHMGENFSAGAVLFSSGAQPIGLVSGGEKLPALGRRKEKE
jgi:hypothetical protein